MEYERHTSGSRLNWSLQMPKLSIAVVGRDDGYGDDTLSPYNASTPDTFCFRMKRTIENNLGLFEKKGVAIVTGKQQLTT